MANSSKRLILRIYSDRGNKDWKNGRTKVRGMEDERVREKLKKESSRMMREREEKRRNRLRDGPAEEVLAE